MDDSAAGAESRDVSWADRITVMAPRRCELLRLVLLYPLIQDLPQSALGFAIFATDVIMRNNSDNVFRHVIAQQRISVR